MRLFGHPVHQMLIPFPLGLLTTAFVFDLVHLGTGSGRWADIAFWMITAGVLGGLAAALFGAVDWARLPRNTRAWRVGLLHGAGNAVVLVLFIISWFMRLDEPLAPSGMAIALGGMGVALSAVTGWLGGELVDQLGVGVNEHAHLDAPSSLGGGQGPAARPWRRGAHPVRS